MGHMTPILSPQNLLSCDTHHQQGCRGGRLDGAWWFLRRRGYATGCGLEENEAPCRAWAFWFHGITAFALFFRVVSDNCYPFVGREQNEAGTSSRCMMHSRAMGRGKRQATSRCPNGQVDSNDIYQVTPAYRLGSDVSLK